MSKSSVAGRASRADVLPSASALTLTELRELALRLVRKRLVFNAPQIEGVMDAELLGLLGPQRQFASHMV
ncbi:hypothetical protein CEP54_015017 [Fusarium duplospermum]|uniref:Uncharacterized protein n=1 Tax=Fusarium duplospermum TaxID=1325734 RepID=A0A428NS72_9HYPO|nr:hypothetical protein CEP54_015017 [Fusarium duplospermum]